jgi:hypothetical protein
VGSQLLHQQAGAGDGFGGVDGHRTRRQSVGKSFFKREAAHEAAFLFVPKMRLSRMGRRSSLSSILGVTPMLRRAIAWLLLVLSGVDAAHSNLAESSASGICNSCDLSRKCHRYVKRQSRLGRAIKQPICNQGCRIFSVIHSAPGLILLPRQI